MSGLVFTSPWMLLAGGVCCAGVFVVAAVRRIDVRAGAAALWGLGVILLALACGGPALQLPVVQPVAVMVDLSPSTRGALYRDPRALRSKLQDLLPGVPFRIYFFGDKNQIGSLANTEPLADMACEKTVFTPADLAAIVLFSDGRFDPPQAAPPIYPVEDPLLDDPPDAAITGIEFIGDKIAVTVHDGGPQRMLTIHSGSTVIERLVKGDQTVMAPAPASGYAVAELPPADDWPENDRLSVRAFPAFNSEHWWVGENCPSGWRAMPTLPADAADYLAASEIVLNNVAAESLSEQAQVRLEQYVRDLGGAVVIVGGDHAFGAGGYIGTPLDAISPLGSSPPGPAQNWIILTDASGSMSQEHHWESAVGAVTRLLPAIPPKDSVRLGQFSDALRWWNSPQPAGEAASEHFPPADAAPHGPTNLQAALEAIAGAPSGAVTQVILLTDADTAIDQPAALAAKLHAANVRLNLMAIANGSGLAELQSIAGAAGGSVLTQSDPAQWPATLKQLVTQAIDEPLRHSPIEMTSSLFAGTYVAESWNPTWLKATATALSKPPLEAQWQVGLGRVLAIAVPGTKVDIVSPPHDPRFRTTWRCGPESTVSVEAGNNGSFLNNQAITLELWNPDTGQVGKHPLPQTAPGKYSLTFRAPDYAAIATIRANGNVIDRAALPKWYAPEFSAIGEDEAALQSLARRTGGRVIGAGQSDAIDFRWRPRRVAIAGYLAFAAAASLLIGLLLWKSIS